MREQVVNGLLRGKAAHPQASTVLGIVPLGSGSDFVRTLGWTDALLPALERIAAGNVRPVDAGFVTAQSEVGEVQRFFVNECSVGLGGVISSKVHRCASMCKI